MSRPGVIPLVEDNPDDVLVTLRGVRALERTGGQGPELAARRLRRIGWATLMFICLGCRPHPAAGPVSESVDGPAARSDGRVDVATAGEDDIPERIEITGTAERLMALPRVGGLLISDHGQMPIGRGRWKITGYCAVKDTPEVLIRIRELGLRATVPMSVAERKLRMQPAPTPPRCNGVQDVIGCRW